MIKIEKDLTQVPASLQVPPMNRSAIATHKIRERIIRQSRYPKNSSAVDKRYKMEDIKDALFKIYNGKCAFCEQRVERWHVEHFRPKSEYYWLAFSWDNLLYACPDCNGSKSNHFHLDKEKNPLFINPEMEDPSPLITFQKDGLVSSADARMKYTLEKCSVYRKYLNDNRKKIWDDFLNDLESEVVDGKSKHEIQAGVMALVNKFRRDAEQRPRNEFLAFRRYAVKNFLAEAIREILG
ncbi:MAG: retron system putative HNH endonuclease [Saprospiraceae bacterium]